MHDHAIAVYPQWNAAKLDRPSNTLAAVLLDDLQRSGAVRVRNRIIRAGI